MTVVHNILNGGTEVKLKEDVVQGTHRVKSRMLQAA